MNTLEVLMNNIKYNKKYTDVNENYNYFKNSITEIMNDYTICDNTTFKDSILLTYYRQLMGLYEGYRETVLNNYHYDFIRNDNPMVLLDKFTKYIATVEEHLECTLDIDTEGECKL